MGDYNLTGLNESDFEHMTQALALKVVASGVTPFGEGPDGGREATFTGKMMHPTTAEPWDGYLVMQSKFCKRPSGDTKKDGQWALSELKKDLAKFSDSSRSLPKPEYYIFVTNMVLTAVQDVGSKDQAIMLLEDHLVTVGFKGYDIWDYDKLCRFLDGSQDVANKYAGFITSGDVLSKALQILDSHQADFGQIMSLFLQSELRADQFAKLEQAGHSVDQKTWLAHVFVDLLAFNRPLADPPPSEIDQNQLVPGIVAELVEAGSYVLRASSLPVDPKVVGTNGQPDKHPGRFVIVGGPGQGKSTVSQFVCQLYRAAILKDQPSHTLGGEVRTALDLFVAQCASDGVQLPAVRRFPVKVVLDQFASEIANGQVNSLLSYILKRVNDVTRRDCSPVDLRSWLSVYPWLLVLDGLDEVPATSNRVQLLEMVVDFWNEVAVLNADMLVVATTRPQGYSDEFSPQFYQHRYLAPLSAARALHYSERLTNARYSGSPEQKERVLKRLAMACHQETTIRLMRSPLQVTIMAALVDRVGQPPQERWRLFQLYYDVIYQREIEREVPASGILRERKADVDAIHRRVALLLQTQSEQAGSTDARLSKSGFEGLVRARMNEEGYEDVELEARTHEITEAALLRLVFLVGLEANNIGFEIRSLQEFMAAEALMDGHELQVRERLATIAPVAHWRNVFLFAAGKCFADIQYLRDCIIGICDQLNEPLNDRLAAATLTGSKLALEVWSDGVARGQKKFEIQLARLSLKLLWLPDEAANARLAAAYNPAFEDLFRAEVEGCLSQESFFMQVGAWTVLKVLVKQAVTWAIDTSDKSWPVSPMQQRHIFELVDNDIPKAWVPDKLVRLIPSISPFQLLSERLRNVASALRETQNLPEWTSALPYIHKNVHDCLNALLLPEEHDDRPVKLALGPLNRAKWEAFVPLRTMPFKHPGWAPYLAAARFIDDPSPSTLSTELAWLSSAWDLSLNVQVCDLPWPLAACIDGAQSRDDLLVLSDRAKSGLGSYEDWTLAEARWESKGVAWDDLVSLTDEQWPFGGDIRRVGYPLAASVRGPADNFSFIWRRLWACHESVPGTKAKAKIAELLGESLAFPARLLLNITVSATPDELMNVYSEVAKPVFYIDALQVIDFPTAINDAWLAFFDWLGRLQPIRFMVGHIRWEKTKQLAAAFVSDSTKRGLFEILSTLALSGNEFDLPRHLVISKLGDAETRLNALFLRLSQHDWDDTEAPELAAIAFDCAMAEVIDEDRPQVSGTDVIEFVCLILRRGGFNSVGAQTFLLSLWDKLSEARSEKLKMVLESMNILMAQRNSNLGENGRWVELALPSLHL